MASSAGKPSLPVSRAIVAPTTGPSIDAGRFGNSHCRWSILFSLAVLATATLPLLLSFKVPRSVAWVNLLGVLFVGFAWVWIAITAAVNLSHLFQQPVPSIAAAQLSRERTFRHIVVVPCYTDPIEVLFDCLCSLLTQSEPGKLVAVVAFEARTPDLQKKIDAVQRGFHGRFGDLVITVHTILPEREIPGGCSNKNYALHQAYKHILAHHVDYETTSYTVTTCDTDSLFSSQYFEVLEACYNEQNPQLVTESNPCRMCVWQPPVFYNWDLDQRPFFVRVTGIVRAMMMLGGLIGFSLNPMSIFSYPLELGLAAGFINPRYSVDDIIFKVRCMCMTGQSIPVLLLPVPVISGPTTGTSYWQEVREWARQLRRWIIGSAESFHYFLIHWRGRPFFSGIRWMLLFFTYYAILLCSAGVFGVVASIPWPWVVYPEHQYFAVTVCLKQVGLVLLFLQYVVLVVAFGIDHIAVKMLTVNEKIGIHRRIFHFVSSPFVLLLYSFIALYAIIKFIFAGKRDAGHIMAGKSGLAAATGQSQPLAREEPLQRSTSSSRHSSFNPSASINPAVSFNPADGGSIAELRHYTSGTLAGLTAELLVQNAASHGRILNVGSNGAAASCMVPDTPPVCLLPDTFYFGETPFKPASVAVVPGRQTYIYDGLLTA